MVARFDIKDTLQLGLEARQEIELAHGALGWRWRWLDHAAATYSRNSYFGENTRRMGVVEELDSTLCLGRCVVVNIGQKNVFGSNRRKTRRLEPKREVNPVIQLARDHIRLECLPKKNETLRK